MNLVMIALVAFLVILAVLVLFQIALAAGAPLGRFAWGGQHEGKLPRRLRIGSLVSIVIYVFMALVALDRTDVTSLMPANFVRVAMWVVFGYLVIGTVMNLISRSKSERITMTPVALVLAVAALILALAPTPAQTYDGYVIDLGDGAEWCEGPVGESDPPQCFGESLEITGWSWHDVEFVDRDSIKWGHYAFDAIDRGDRLELVGLHPAE